MSSIKCSQCSRVLKTTGNVNKVQTTRHGSIRRSFGHLSQVALLLFVLLAASYASADPVHEAARRGDVVEVKRLLQGNPQLANAPGAQDATPLHFAVFNNRKEVVDFLLANGADPNRQLTSGWTPVHVAANNDKKDILQVLLAHGANVDPKGKDGETPLHLAAFKGYPGVVQVLLAGGADVNGRDGGKDTALHRATAMGHKETVQVLLSKGADPNARDAKDLTPLRIAELQGHGDIVQLLKRYIGK